MCIYIYIINIHSTVHIVCKHEPLFLMWLIVIILRGRWMLESDWLSNVLRCAIIFRETHGERSSRHRITCPYHFAKWFALFQRSLQPKNSKRTKTHNDTGQTNKYSKQKDKNDRSYPCFCHKITFYYVRKAHTLSPTLSLPHRQFAHVNIHANVIVVSSHNLVINCINCICISLLSTAQASVTV